MPSHLSRFPVDDLDIPKRLVGLLKKLCFAELGDLDALSHIEFRRYIRTHPTPTSVVLDVHCAIETLRWYSIQLDPAFSPDSIGREPSPVSTTPVSSEPPANLQMISSSSPDVLVEAEYIQIPIDVRGLSVTDFDISVRLANILQHANIRLAGDLHGQTFLEFQKYRNCGRKTVTELRAMVWQLQHASNEIRHSAGQSIEQPTAANPNILTIPQQVRELKLSELPLSTRLEKVLQSRGYRSLGDLDGTHNCELMKVKNCGRQCIKELRAIIRAAVAGEFSATTGTNLTSNLREIARAIDDGLARLSARDRNIFEGRLFGNSGNPRTLEDVGKQYRMTRERVRQIVKDAIRKIRRGGGPKFTHALERIAAECDKRVCPLTAELFSHWLGERTAELSRDTHFYVRILDDLEPSISAWPPGSTRERANDPLSRKITQELESWLRESNCRPTALQAYAELRQRTEFRDLSPIRFLAALRRTQNIVVELSEPDRPELRVSRIRMRILEFARPILRDSLEPLTPEEIVEQAKALYGEEAIVVSARGAGNTLTPEHDFFLLGPRSFGLRQHFKTMAVRWPMLRDQFAKLLQAENRPISTIEVIDRRKIIGFDDANSYEMAQIIREDPRFIDLGRRLFALRDWGIQEREYVKDLLPKVFAEAKHVLTVQQTVDRLTRLRSVSPYSIGNILQKHPNIRSFGFGYFGLVNWGTAETEVILKDRTAIERAVRRATPPITFQALCDKFGVSFDSPGGALLWKTCARSPKLRRAPDKHSAETMLLHKSVSLEQALATIARGLQRPAPAYELEWELSGKFGEIFANIGLTQIEERLTRSARFLRNAAGEFLLDVDFDLENFDVGTLRAASIKSLSESHDIAGCDQLIDRLEQQGFDVDELSADMLASILRGAKELQEVAHQRFRAR